MHESLEEVASGRTLEQPGARNRRPGVVPVGW
jgi:hypothetical protein